MQAFGIPWKGILSDCILSFKLLQKKLPGAGHNWTTDSFGKMNDFGQTALPSRTFHSSSKICGKQTKDKFLLHLQFPRCVAFSWHQNIWGPLVGHLGFSLTITATYKASLTKLAMCDTGKDSEKWAWGRHTALILETINISSVCGSSYCCWRWSTPRPIAQGNNKQLNPDD